MNVNSNQDVNPCQDLKDKIKNIFDSMPLFIKIVLLSTIILYILNLFILYVALYLADIPYFTVYYCQIWRLITTPFITTGILSIIFSLLFWYKDAVKLERDIGTVKYILIFFMN
jgi:membrane associated rhomboid family serine protease